MSDSEDEKSAASGSGGGEEESEEDKAMKALLEGFVDEMGADEDDDASSSSSSSDSGPDRREIDLPDNVLDHVVLAAPELEPAMIEFQEKTGIEPRISGAIKGLGIKTARVSFEGDSFLEIIAPDPEKGGPIGTLLRASGLTGLKPFHWAIRNSKTGDLTGDFKKLGYTPDCISMFGAREDGTPRKWEMLYLYGHSLKGLCPFFINWDNSDHPCESMPIVGDLMHVKVTAPADDKIHKLIAETGSSGFELEEGAANFEIKFDSPEGEVTFSANKMIGFRFPGFEDECGPIEGEEEEEMPEFVMPEMPEMLEVGGNYDDSNADLGEPPELPPPDDFDPEERVFEAEDEPEEGEKKKKKKKSSDKKEKKSKKEGKEKKKKKDKKKDKEGGDDEDEGAGEASEGADEE